MWLRQRNVGEKIVFLSSLRAPDSLSTYIRINSLTAHFLGKVASIYSLILLFMYSYSYQIFRDNPLFVNDCMVNEESVRKRQKMFFVFQMFLFHGGRNEA